MNTEPKNNKISSGTMPHPHQLDTDTNPGRRSRLLSTPQLLELLHIQAPQLAENLGTMNNAHYLGNPLGIRLLKTHYVAGGLHIDLATCMQQNGLECARSSDSKGFCDFFRIKVSSTRPRATFPT